jgi:hypothetical protein
MKISYVPYPTSNTTLLFPASFPTRAKQARQPSSPLPPLTDPSASSVPLVRVLQRREAVSIYLGGFLKEGKIWAYRIVRILGARLLVLP